MNDAFTDGAERPEGGAGRPEGGRSAAPRDRVAWGWRDALICLVIAAAPEIALALVALGSTSTPTVRPTTALAVSTIISALVLDGWYVAWAWRFSVRKYRLPLSDLGFRRPTPAIVWLVPVSLAIVYVVSAVHDHFIHGPRQTLFNVFPHTAAGTVMFVLLACVVAPVLEETFFRGFLFQGFASTFGPVWGAVLSSAVFAAVHWQVSVLIPLFVLGLVLCWVFAKTRSLWTSITLHATFNVIAIIGWAATRH
jgi:membrane protease YdiL (CAAX protease family)